MTQTEFSKDTGLQFKSPLASEEFANFVSNLDPYFAPAMEFALRWGKSMQTQIRNGQSIGSIALPTARMADVDGISSYKFLLALAILAHYWQYGDALRTWHNKVITGRAA